MHDDDHEYYCYPRGRLYDGVFGLPFKLTAVISVVIASVAAFIFTKILAKIFVAVFDYFTLVYRDVLEKRKTVTERRKEKS